jgi:AraC-like DNA-binding protein
LGFYNLKIASKKKELNAVRQKGAVRFLLMKGIGYMIFALEMEQHKVDGNKRKKRGNMLSLKEMEAITEMSSFIQEFSERKYTISGCCKQSGLFTAKLQYGFKKLHATTVTNHIRRVRLDHARHLMRETDLNISQIVHSIGLTSRSYFSKIFRNQFPCSPKEYRNTLGPQEI